MRVPQGDDAQPVRKAAPAVLVTDGEERSVLAACRALALAGFKVTVVAKTRLATALWSRSCSARVLSSDPKQDSEAFVDDLARILEREKHSVLLAGSEASLLAISSHRGRLEPLTRIGLPGHEAVQRSLDKRVLLDEARRVGLDPPPSLVCTDRRSATEAARKLGFPVVLKPVRTVLSGTNGLRQQSVVPAGDENALAEALPSFDGHPLLLQRFLPKTGRFSAAGVMTGSGLLAIAVARFNRTWPPRAGAVAFGETVDPPPGLTPRIEQLLERIGWSGIFELEYLEQPDGRAAAIDLNPRLFGWLTLAVTAGANLPAIWCDRLLGNVSATATAHAGVRYRWEEAEVAHFVWQLQHGKLRAAASVARPHRRVVHAHFRLRDPVPLVAQTLHLAAARASR